MLQIKNPKSVSPVLSVGLALFAFCLFFSPTVLLAQTCSTNKIDKYAVVQHVYDGDTVQLKSGEKIRLIGINTPEMNYKKGKPEPFAQEAKSFLARKVNKQRIGIRYGTDKRDKYKRHLAHIFLADGTNIQAALIEKGYAINIAIPPNLWQQTCYQSIERRARSKRTGLWSAKRFQPIDAAKVNQQTLGFRLVKGKIESVKKTRKSIWLNMSNKMSLRISKSDKNYFKSHPVQDWQGKTITAKG